MSIASLFQFPKSREASNSPARRENEKARLDSRSLNQIMASSRARAWIPAHLIESLGK